MLTMRYISCLFPPLFFTCLTATGGPVKVPQLSDDRLRITLYAADPDIVTPIACVVDMQDRLYVIESHTHSPPSEYPGPDGDLIKVFEGSRLDGRFAERSVFADGIYQAQSLGIAPNGDLYVVCTREVLILHDDDGDGRAEARTRVLHIDHAGDRRSHRPKLCRRWIHGETENSDPPRRPKCRFSHQS